jgi:hypothetical protein
VQVVSSQNGDPQNLDDPGAVHSNTPVIQGQPDVEVVDETKYVLFWISLCWAGPTVKLALTVTCQYVSEPLLQVIYKKNLSRTSFTGYL